MYRLGFYYLKSGVSKSLQLQVGRRDYIPSESSCALVSYPKSGNTWLRSVLASVLTKTDLNLSDVELIIPDIYKRRLIWLNRESPALFKSHEPYHPWYKKVVYMVRDPRDVVISYYHYQKLNGQVDLKTKFDDYLDLFLSGKNSSYGKWSNHVAGWMPSLESGEALIIKYEDMKTDPVGSIKAVCEFAGLEFADELINQALQFNTISRMKKKTDKWEEIKGGDNVGFFREGKSKSYKEELSFAQEKKIIDAFGNTMKSVGYKF